MTNFADPVAALLYECTIFAPPRDTINPNLPKIWEIFPNFFGSYDVFRKVDEQFTKKTILKNHANFAFGYSPSQIK